MSWHGLRRRRGCTGRGTSVFVRFLSHSFGWPMLQMVMKWTACFRYSGGGQVARKSFFSMCYVPSRGRSRASRDYAP